MVKIGDIELGGFPLLLAPQSHFGKDAEPLPGGELQCDLPSTAKCDCSMLHCPDLLRCRRRIADVCGHEHPLWKL